jgi:hypothetical protein
MHHTNTIKNFRNRHTIQNESHLYHLLLEYISTKTKILMIKANVLSNENMFIGQLLLYDETDKMSLQSACEV